MKVRNTATLSGSKSFSECRLKNTGVIASAASHVDSISP